MLDRELKRYFTAEQIQIDYRIWLPKQTKAIILVIHGLGSHSAHYEALGKYMASREICVYAIDLRGFGNSKFRLNRLRTFSKYTSDLEQLVKIAQTEFPGKPIFMLGESLGAIIGINSAVVTQNELAGLILISPALIPYVSFRFLREIASRIYKKSLSDLPTPYPLAKISSDPNYLNKIKFDPLYRSKIPFYFGKIMWESQKEASKQVKLIRRPVLILHSRQDRIVKLKGAKRIYKKLKVSDKQLHIFKKSYHTILNDLEKNRAYELVSNWVRQHSR